MRTASDRANTVICFVDVCFDFLQVTAAMALSTFLVSELATLGVVSWVLVNVLIIKWCSEIHTGFCVCCPCGCRSPSTIVGVKHIDPRADNGVER